MGGTEAQEELFGCIVDSAGAEPEKTASSETPLVVVILDRKEFLRARRLFRAYKTENAFSSLSARRIYLFSKAVAGFDGMLKYAAHELRHFAANSLFESNAELKGSRIRCKARRACGGSAS